ncbi:MAG: type II toxin-antitoxin system VapC family toxin [Thermoanaerobaculia bacterium]
MAEFGNILWKKMRRGDITKEEAIEILKAFAALPLDVYRSAALLPAAFEIAVTLDRSIYDSLYLALATTEDCSLVTADSKFHAVVGRELVGRPHPMGRVGGSLIRRLAKRSATQRIAIAVVRDSSLPPSQSFPTCEIDCQEPT